MPQIKSKNVLLKRIARGIDLVVNHGATGRNRTTGFCLLVFPFDGGGADYVTNAGRREDMVQLLRSTADRLEARLEAKVVPFPGKASRKEIH